MNLKFHKTLYNIFSISSILIIIDIFTSPILKTDGGFISVVIAYILKYILFFMEEKNYYVLIGFIISISRVSLLFLIAAALYEKRTIKKYVV